MGTGNRLSVFFRAGSERRYSSANAKPTGLSGTVGTEALQQWGGASFLEPRWWNVGYAKLATGEDLNYLGVSGLRIAGGQGVAIIAICQVR